MHRVLIVSHTYVSPASRGKLRALAARGLEVTVGVPQRWPEPGAVGGRKREIATPWERQNGVEVFPIPTRGERDRATYHFGRRALAALLRDKRPDVVQVEEEPGTPAAKQVVRLARRLGAAAVLFASDNAAHTGGNDLLARWGRRRTLRSVRGVVASSSAAAGLIRQDQPEMPVAVVPQLGVTVPTSAEHVPHEGLAIGVVGRLVPRKGVDTLLEALSHNRGDNWHLTIVGDGPDRERLERLASELRLAARIRWAGALPADLVPKLWREWDVLVLPSRAEVHWSEPTAHVLVEAMAHEVAVLGTDTGVIPEVIGDAGVVVPAGVPAAMSGALRDLADESRRRPLAQAGRARVMKEFSDDAVAERTLAFWREVVEK